MRRVLSFDFTPTTANHVKALLQGRELVLLDSSALISLVRTGQPAWILKLIVEWRKYGARAICGVCDFIRREAVNAERWYYGAATVQSFLKEASRRPSAMYVEVETPVTDVDDRATLIDTLPRNGRRILISADDLSVADKCLILVSATLKGCGVKNSVATMDRGLMEAGLKVGVKVRYGLESALKA